MRLYVAMEILLENGAYYVLRYDVPKGAFFFYAGGLRNGCKEWELD